MELTKLRKDLKKGKLFAFESILALYLENPQAGFAEGEAQILEEYMYQVKLYGDSDEAVEVITEKFTEDLREYYLGREKMLKMLKNL